MKEKIVYLWKKELERDQPVTSAKAMQSRASTAGSTTPTPRKVPGYDGNSRSVKLLRRDDEYEEEEEEDAEVFHLERSVLVQPVN